MTYNEISSGLQSGKLPIDKALTELAKLGYSPALINGDDGKWTVAINPSASVPDEEKPADKYLTFFVPGDTWEGMPVDALKAFMKRNNDPA